MRTEAFTTADIHFLVNQAIVAGMRRTRSIGDYMTPTNLDDAKDEFLSRSVLTPNFQYRKIDFDPIEEELALRRVLVPIGVWPELSVYQDKVRDHLTTSAIVTSRGDVDKLKELNKELFGNPTERTLAYAQQVLKTFPDHMAIPETVNPEEIVRGLKEELEKYGLSEEWDVAQSQKRPNVYVNSRTIIIPSNHKRHQGIIKQLRVHEVGVHALRSHNGGQQPLEICKGTPGYLKTEEGLAMYCEELTGNLGPNRFRGIAGLALTVDNFYNGVPFKKAFDFLRDHNFTEDDTWRITSRVYKGGGFAKDHWYLSGYLEVCDFVGEGGDLKELYVGKVGIKDLPWVRNLRDEGVLKAPDKLPDFLQ